LNIRPVEIIADTHSPTRPEEVHLLRENVIVHEACVDTERGHEQDDVATAEEDLKDLVALDSLLELVFSFAHPRREN